MLYTKINYNKDILYNNYKQRKQICIDKYDCRNYFIKHWIMCFDYCTCMCHQNININTNDKDLKMITKLQRMYYLCYELHTINKL